MAHLQPLQRTNSWPCRPMQQSLFSRPMNGQPARPPRVTIQTYAQAACTTTETRSFIPRVNTFRQSTQPANRSRQLVVTRASWGAPVEFSSAKLISNKVAVPGMHQVLVDVGATIGAGYTKPGQYIQVKTTPDAKAGFFAIASAPDPNNQGVLELLIKVQPASTAEAICALASGAELLVSPVQGKGFPVDRIPAGDFPTVLMFATGSGISPIKAVIESGILQADKRKDVRLYYGTRDPESTAYQSLIPEWVQQGIKVIQVHSGQEKTYVQDVFAKEVDQVVANPESVGVLLCGQKGMCTSVTELCNSKGVQQVMMNF